MSQENVEIIREGYAALTRDGPGWMDERVAEDFEFFPLTEIPGLEDVYRGRAGWEAFLDDWFQAWESQRVTVKRMQDLGDQVLVLVVSEVRGKGSGVTVEVETAHLWTLRGGLVVRGVVYSSWQQALEAVGLSE